MNVLRYLAGNARPLNTLFNEYVLKDRNAVRTRQSNRNMMGETYEGTGKTTGYILNKKGTDVICVDYVTVHGFKLTNGWKIVGPTIFFPYAMMGWRIENMLEINEESLALFSLLRPKLDCLFIGYGLKEEMSYTRIRELIALCRKMNLNAEILETHTAAATFNFCSLDRRFVAAALIPPKKISSIHNLLPIAGPKETRSQLLP